MRLLLLPFLAFWLGCHAQDKRVVVTLDDLPCANCPDGTWDQVNTDLLRTLNEHHVPAIGFVNESKLYRNGTVDSARYTLLERWLNAGMDLGNHTYAHLGATRHSLQAYETDIVNGERLLRPLLLKHGKELHYFRHPFLQTGPTPGYRDSLNAVIEKHGYTIAPVTFDNDEYIYAACYGQAVLQGNDSAAERIAAQYLAYMAGSVHFHEAQVLEFLGRPIPHILLLHANTLNAAKLHDLLTWFEQEGYTFITLAEALKDPCYALPESTTRYGFSWIRRWQEAAGHRPPWPPEVDADVQLRYEALQTR